MNRLSSSPASDLECYDAQATLLQDRRPHPTEDALRHLGLALMSETLHEWLGTGLEDFHTTVAESLIGAFHSAAGRIESNADRARDDVRRLERDFDGSEVADSELQDALLKVRAAEVARMAVEVVRDAAAETYTNLTGEVWTAWRGHVRGNRTTAAQIEAKDALRIAKARKQGLADPGQTIVAFRGSPKADTREDATRIFDALNWAHTQWPGMALATTCAPGAEKLAIRWAAQKKITLVRAAPNFDKHGKAAPFRANDEMIELDPVCCITLAHSLNVARGEASQPFGPALNLGQKAAEKGIRHIPVRLRAA